MNEPFVVSRITFKTTKLVDANNQFHNSISIWDAKKQADEAGLQLVCFNLPPIQSNDLPLCKIIDFGKWKYANDKHQKKIQLEQRHEVKEVRFSPHISDNDISHKTKHAKEFLEEGHTLILVMKVTGRDLSHMDLAEAKMTNIINELSSDGKLVSRKTEGGQIVAKMVKN